jgi:carboxymethylenebutenolidase
VGRVTQTSIEVDGGSYPGYLAMPAGDPAGPWPGVVVIHEAFGLTEDMKRAADQIAGHGYLALAPDLFGGKSWIRCVRSAFMQLRAGSGPAFTVLDAARTALAGRDDCTGKVGVIGFCMGGGFALLCAPRDGFGAASVNYGEVPKDAQDMLAGACPVVGSFGRKDPMGVKHPERLEQALTALDVAHDVKVYPNSGHRFLTESTGAGAMFGKVTGMRYHPEDAADAWDRIYSFFGAHLNA